MAAQPRHPSLHMAGQMRRAHALRQQARDILEESLSMADQLRDRIDRYGWDDHIVIEGLRIRAVLEAKCTALLAEAKRYDGLMLDIGA